MFKLNVDDRLSSWAALRAQLETSEEPFQLVIDFWRNAPFVPYNRHIDPFNRTSWPSPWEIIVENQYDDFTKALMMAYSLKFTQKYKDTKIEVRSLIDKSKSTYYNIVCVDSSWAINYNDNSAVLLENIPDSFFIENLIEVNPTR